MTQKGRSGPNGDLATSSDVVKMCAQNLAACTQVRDGRVILEEDPTGIIVRRSAGGQASGTTETDRSQFTIAFDMVRGRDLMQLIAGISSPVVHCLAGITKVARPQLLVWCRPGKV